MLCVLRDTELGNLEEICNTLHTFFTEVADYLVTFGDARWRAVRFDIHAAATRVKLWCHFWAANLRGDMIFSSKLCDSAFGPSC